MNSLAVKLTPVSNSQRQENVLGPLLNRPLLLAVLLALAIVVLYYPATHFRFVNYDDGDYVYRNAQVQSGLSWATVQWAFTTSHAANWHPLTWLSHALDCQIFGLKPAGPHAVNIFLHVLNAVLLFWVMQRATGLSGRSFMVAALFALHPINVESVAWIAERKNLLSMVFFLLALGAYRWYASRPDIRRYLLVGSLFALGLMAKPQVITLPCVLLLWDYWPLQRMFPDTEGNSDSRSAQPETPIPGMSFRWLIAEKLPPLILSAASAVITMKVQRLARTPFPRYLRIENAILSYAKYVKKAVWPVNFALFYPHPAERLSGWRVVISGLLLLGITVLVILGRRRRYLPVGWLWFVGTLVPMIGLIQVGLQAMADRYAYLSFVGLFILLCWGFADLCESTRMTASLLPAVSVFVLLLLAWVTHRQINYWQSDEVLWTHTLQITTRNSVGESSLGAALAMDGRADEAVSHFYKALALNPSDSEANMGLAVYLLLSRDYSEAIPHYQRVVKDENAHHDMRVNAYVGMAKAYLALGQKVKAQECLQAARQVTAGLSEL